MSELIDNRSHRVRTLKELIQELHRGADPDAVRGKLRTLVRETDSSEIAAMEQELIAGGMPVEEVQSMCDLHSQVLSEILVQPVQISPRPGHPLDTFKRENEALTEVVAEMREAAVDLATPAGLARCREVFGRLMDVDKHYQRKEHLLFSCLERHGVTGPSKVMWGKDDEVRKQLAALGEALSADDVAAGEAARVADTLVAPALAAVEEMIRKEEMILFPMSRDTLTADEWGEIWQETPRFGYCLVEPREGYRPPTAAATPDKVADLARDQAIVFATGALNFDQLRGLFAALPVDLTFVDADDRVRYFSEGADRVFERSKAILGRKVHHCHPPKSVHVVEKIVSSFRAGTEDVAEFWIDFRGRFVHIRYFAVRDEEGAYLGTLEVTQDLTRLRQLEGERRLLQFEGNEREAAEQPAAGEPGATPHDVVVAEDGPAPWVDARHVVWTVNADELLAAGTHPLAEVQRRVKTLATEELGLIRSSFRPSPLIDILENQGFRIAVVRSGDSFATFISLQADAKTMLP